MITSELMRLPKFSEQNNITKINNIVKFLLGNPDFLILCYESIKSNPRVHTPQW